MHTNTRNGKETLLKKGIKVMEDEKRWKEILCFYNCSNEKHCLALGPAQDMEKIFISVILQSKDFTELKSFLKETKVGDCIQNI